MKRLMLVLLLCINLTGCLPSPAEQITRFKKLCASIEGTPVIRLSGDNTNTARLSMECVK
jgi:hypothetical protein